MAKVQIKRTRLRRVCSVSKSTTSALYAATCGGGVFKSTDGGGVWSAVNTGLTATCVQALAVDPATPSMLYAGTRDGGVFAMQQFFHQIYLPIVLRGQ